MSEIVIPEFLLDCQDWIVLEPHEAGLPEELAEEPVLVALSTAVVDGDDLHSANGVITVGLLDGAPLPTRPLAGDGDAERLLDYDAAEIERYVAPVPGGGAALVAEFTLSGDAPSTVRERVGALMRSFRWAISTS